jgi:arsenite methyltransferase
MLTKARRNKELTDVQNTEFIRAPITDISPLPANSADCIISNCVINLVPEAEKQLAFNEMARLLKRQGRVAISDILLKKDLIPALKQDMALYVGCIAGASHVEDYEHYLRAAGFQGPYLRPMLTTHLGILTTLHQIFSSPTPTKI